MPTDRQTETAFGLRKGSPPLDPLNVRLLALLAQEPRQSTAKLARQLGVSAPTTRKRLRRLEESGVDPR